MKKMNTIVLDYGWWFLVTFYCRLLNWFIF